jgi:adenylate cyclase class IV
LPNNVTPRNAPGVLVVVCKRRLLVLDSVPVHLDNIEEAGTFMEI